MSDTLTLTGQLSIVPDSTTDADLSADFAVKLPLSKTLTLSRKKSTTIVLADTTPVVVSLADIVNVHALVIHASAAITATITSASGSAQVVAVDNLLVLMSSTAPITALTLTAIASATVQLTLGRV